MKINNKGYASTIIMFSILTLFLISMLMLVKTMNNSSSLNKKITEKVVDNIYYDSSGSVQNRLSILENQLKNMENSMLDKIYPVGSVYISTTDDTIEKVKERFPNTKWEVYASGRTLVSAGAYTKSDGSTIVYNAGDKGGNVSTKLTTSNIPTLSVMGTTSSNGEHKHSEFGHVYGSGRTETLPAQTLGVIDGYYKWSFNSEIGGGYTALGITGSSGAHTHTFTGTYTNNSLKEVSTQDPYMVTYMYKRVS
jgi:hypothetical protein